jgi:hypothetical protein
VSKEDWIKIGKGALIAGAGSALTYLATKLPGLDLGVGYFAIISPIAMVVINAARKWLAEQADDE